MALTEDEHVYEWGEDEIFHTASERTHKNEAMEPTVVFGNLDNEKVIQLASGDHHRLALTSTREVYAWGENFYGQLGTGNRQGETKPVKVAGFRSKIMYVACGDNNIVRNG